jgi:hypothetical protein
MRSASAGPVLLCGALLWSACVHESSAPPVSPPCSYEAANDGTQSYEILCREPVSNHVKVKHILIGWKDLASVDHGPDSKASERTYAEAQALARELLQKLRSGAAIEPLMQQYSDDPGSASSGQAYDASPDAALVSAFKSLSLRLQIHEAGVVKTGFGLHVIQRVE